MKCRIMRHFIWVFTVCKRTQSEVSRIQKDLWLNSARKRQTPEKTLLKRNYQYTYMLYSLFYHTYANHLIVVFDETLNELLFRKQ